MYVMLPSNPFSYYGVVWSGGGAEEEAQGVMCLNAVCCYLLKQRKERGEAAKRD